MTQNSASTVRIQQTLAFINGLGGLLFGLCLLPPVFNRVMAVMPLLEKENEQLWLVSIVLILLSLSLILFRKKVKSSFVLITFSVLFLGYIELGYRFIAHFTMGDNKKFILHKTELNTYPEYTGYKGHPFVGHTGRPSLQLDGSEQVERLYVFNRFGFRGPDWEVEKPANTIRVATLGGSTTVRGYPDSLSAYLNASSPDTNIHFEILNFGVSSWTSAHSMVNYLMNVVEFEPDYILIHHGWNDSDVRNVPPEYFRSDYSHAFSHFREPEIPDVYLMRWSLLYRAIRESRGLTPSWALLGSSTLWLDRPMGDITFNNLDELKPFKRNIRTMIQQAMINETKVILSTLPRSTDKNSGGYYTHENIDQCNQICRELAKQFGDEILFLDLDKQMTGSMNELFIDVGHMSPAGLSYKGHQFANTILQDLVQGDSISLELPQDSI